MAFLALFAGADAARAASATFSPTPTDANIGNAANYVGAPAAAPGNTTGVAINDIITFNSAPLLLADGVTPVGTAANPITIDTGRTIGGITFDTASAQAFQIGTNAGNALRLSNIGVGTNTIQLTTTVVNSQLIAAPIIFAAPSSTNGAYTFQNNSTTAGVTLTLSGTMLANTSASRPGVLIFGGTSASANTVSGVITSPGQGQLVPLLIKRGTGTWILSAANSFTGTAVTNATTTNYGIQVLDGVLSLQNNQALGTSATANANQVYIGNKSTTYTYNGGFTNTFTSASGGGTLELANNITLDNGLLLNLVNGGTIRSNGSTTTNAGISLSAVAATSATLSTVNATDLFTVGNALNDVTGGASDTVVNVSGPGTVLLSQASNYAGGYSVNTGTLRVGNATALGAAATANVTFGAGSTGRLQLNGNSATVVGLSTNATAGTPVVENGAAGTATLTVNNAAANTYAGVLQNGTVGLLALTKGGAGALTLSGANTFSGPTTVGAGTLFVNNASGSGTGTSAVNVTSAGTLGGNGTISGAVTVAGRLSPGAAGTGSIGNLTVGSLTLSAGTNLDYDLTNTSTLDQITVTNAGGLTINGGQFNLNGATGTFTANGVYNLIGYNGAVGGTGVSALTLNGSNQDLTNKTYTFGLSGSFVTLTVANNAVTVDYYVPNADSAYSNGANWSTGTPPNAVGAFAAFGGNGSAALTANRTVTVDGAYTVGTLSFNSANGFGYTLANGGAGTGLTLNNGASGAFVTDSAGSHTVASGLTLTPNGATFSVTAAADTLTVSGIVGSDATTDVGLTKSGNGTLAMTGANTYFGGTNLTGGTLQINNAASLGDASGALTFGGGTLQLLADVTTPRNYQVTGSSNAVIDTNGHNLNLGGTLTPVGGAAGGVVKNGLGTLTLGGTNTYTGTTAINAGVVSVAADAGLGAAPATAATNLTIGAGTLQATAGFTLNANRNITLSNAASTIDVENGAFVAYAGVMSGSGNLNLTGAGTLSLSAPQTFAGNTIITGANLQFNVGAGLPGTITLNNGATFSLQSTGSTSVFPGNTIIVAAGATATLSSNILSNAPGSLITSVDSTGVLNLNGQISLGANNVKQFTTGYTGTVHLNANTGLRFSGTITGVGDGGDTTTFDLGAGSSVVTKNTGNISLGALTGTGGIFGASAGTTTYTIGLKNLSTTFAGTINNNNNVTVAGTGTLTLTGANTYTGVTTINSGSTLQIDNGGTTGTLGTGTVTNNGIFAYNRGDATTVATTFSGSGTLVTLGGTTTFTSEVDEGAINPRFGTAIFDAATAGLAANALSSTIAPVAGDNATVTVQNNGSYNVNSNNLIVGGLGTGTLNVNGPTVAGNGATGGVVSLVAGLTIGNSATAVGTVNLNAAGTLVTPLIGTGGGTSTLNLNGGTLVAASGATGTFMTGLTAANVQAGGAIINDGGNTITIAQALRHDPSLGATADGGLVKAGTGMLTLSVANTFNGGTTVSAGTLTIAANGGLGTGNVTIASAATLSLATGVVFAHNGAAGTTLTLMDTSSVLNLAATTAGTVQDVVSTLVVAGTTYTTPGYYGSSTSGVPAAFVIPQFTGNGVLGLRVTPPAVPEPSTWAVMLVGIGGLWLVVRRTRCV